MLWHNKGIKISLSFFFVLLIVDFVSILINWELLPFLEANPVYKYVGLPGIFIINLIIIGAAFWFYGRRKDSITRFAIINGLLIVCLIRFFVIINNFRVWKNPPPLEIAMQVIDAMKQAQMIQIIAPAFLPYFIGYAAFWLFSLDHKIEVKMRNRGIKNGERWCLKGCGKQLVYKQPAKNINVTYAKICLQSKK